MDINVPVTAQEREDVLRTGNPEVLARIAHQANQGRNPQLVGTPLVQSGQPVSQGPYAQQAINDANASALRAAGIMVPPTTHPAQAQSQNPQTAPLPGQPFVTSGPAVSTDADISYHPTPPPNAVQTELEYVNTEVIIDALLDLTSFKCAMIVVSGQDRFCVLGGLQRTRSTSKSMREAVSSRCDQHDYLMLLVAQLR